MKKKTADGVIILHTHLPDGLLTSEGSMTGVPDPTESTQSRTQLSVRGAEKKKAEASPPGPKPGLRQSRFSHASFRRLQAKMEADNQQAKEIIEPLLETENGFMKELDVFLSQRDVTELRRKEMLHKRWTEHVWFPLQTRVEERVSSCSAADARRRQSLYTHYLHHCNSKGFVFLETYDLREYNPFVLHIKKQLSFKLSADDLKEPSSLQIHERLKEKRAAPPTEAGCKHQLPQRDRPLSESQASSHYRVPAFRKPPPEDGTGGRKSSRLDNIPYHIRATATPDGRCHRSSCWFSRGGC